MIGIGIGIELGGGLTPIQQMISAIRRNGGTLLMTDNAFSGAYVDITGTQPVTALGDLLGLVLDRSYGGALGPELVANGGFDTDSAGWSAYMSTPSVSGGVLTLTANGTPDFPQISYPVTGLTVGKLYEISAFAARGTTTSPAFISLAAGVNANTSSTVLTKISVKWIATTTSTSATLGIFGGAVTGTALFDSVSVREIPGNHATQSAVASKPSVQRVPKRLGPNLVVNGDFSGGTTGWSASGASMSVSGGELANTGIAAAPYPEVMQDFSTVVGKTYAVRGADRRGTSANGAWVLAKRASGAGNIASSPVTTSTSSTPFVFEFVALDTSSRISLVQNAGTADTGTTIFDNIAVQEVLEWTNVISFDGSNDFLQLSQPVFTAANDDGFVCAGVIPNTLTGVQTVVASRGPSGTPTNCANGLFISSGAPLAYWEGGVSQALTGSTVTAGVPVVISARKSGSAVSLRVNGVVAQTATSTVSNSVIANTSIGMSLSGVANAPLLPGNQQLAAAVMCKGVVSDADVLLIEQGIAALQGRTL
jgi:hypothetical protein